MRDFLGAFPSLQEVECSGVTLETEVAFLSMTLYTKRDDKVIAKLMSADNTCLTYVAFASCTLIKSGDRRGSVVRTLVSDLEEGESVNMGCNVTGFGYDSSHPQVFSWSKYVKRRRSKERSWIVICCVLPFVLPHRLTI